MQTIERSSVDYKFGGHKVSVVLSTVQFRSLPWSSMWSTHDLYKQLHMKYAYNAYITK